MSNGAKRDRAVTRAQARISKVLIVIECPSTDPKIQPTYVNCERLAGGIWKVDGELFPRYLHMLSEIQDVMREAEDGSGSSGTR